MRIYRNEIKFIKFLKSNYSINHRINFIIKNVYSIQAPDGTFCFGAFDNNNNIYIARKIEKIQKGQKYITIAHEYRHFMQKYLGMNYDEKDAEDFAQDVYKMYKCNIRRNMESCKDCEFCKIKEKINDK